MAKPNGTIEDVCAAIGFTATAALIDWYGGANLYVPAKADEKHHLAGLLGMPALRALCRDFGSLTVWIPASLHAGDTALKKKVAQMLGAGAGSAEVAAATGLSQRRVQWLRLDMESRGEMPLLLGQRRPGKRPPEKRG